MMMMVAARGLYELEDDADAVRGCCSLEGDG